jgi:hypothetical protein
MDEGPPVSLLSAKQLRFLARIRTLRPTAELRWRTESGGWSLDVVEQRNDKACRSLLKARLGSDGTIRTGRSWI